MFVLDSQGDMLRKIERLDVFAGRLKDRLVILDPEDAVPPALNFFQIGAAQETLRRPDQRALLLPVHRHRQRPDGQTGHRRHLLAQVDACPSRRHHRDPEGRDGGAGQGASRCPATPRPSPASTASRRIFSAISSSRKRPWAERASRLRAGSYTILGNPKFVEMFAARENRFSARAAMEEKKIVLVNTSPALFRPGGLRRVRTLFHRPMPRCRLRAGRQSRRQAPPRSPGDRRGERILRCQNRAHLEPGAQVRLGAIVRYAVSSTRCRRR